MNREIVSELVSVAKLDTTAATKEARAWADRLRAVEAETKKVTDATKTVGSATDKLRAEMLRLRKEEAAGVIDKKTLAGETKKLRIGLTEQADAAKKLREETKRLREEEKAAAAEMKAAAKIAAEVGKARINAAKEAAKAEIAAARESAKAQTAAIREVAKAQREADKAAREAERTRAALPRLAARNDAMAHAERSNWRKMQASGERISGLQDSLAAGDRRLMQLNRPFGGVRTAIGDGFGALRARVQGIADQPGQFVGDAASKFGSGAGGLVRAGAGAAAAGALGVGGVVAGIASKGGDFEALRASLETVEGSASKAASTFKLIQTFAAQTPYGVEETTNSLLKLKARGLDASLPSLKAYGDTASAMGKSMDQMIEAVTDATTGEFERLKEFGVKAKTEGDNVKLTFKGITTTVSKDAKSIEGYLVNLGKTQFAGGMERQSKTLKGMLSSLGDSVSQLADTAFQNGLGAALKEIVADLTGATGSGEEFAKVLGQTLGTAVKGAYKFVKDLIGPVEELPGKLAGVADAVGTVATVVKGLIDVGAKIAGVLGPGNTALIALGAAATAALGPIGLLLAAGYGLGKAFGAARDAIGGTTSAVEEFKRKQRELEASDRQNIATRQQQENADRLAARNETESKSFESAEAVTKRFKLARLRRMGKTYGELSDKERRQLDNDAAIASSQARRAGRGRDNAGDETGRAIEGIVGGEERAADNAEIGRLRGKKRKTGSEKKRLKELEKQYDLETGSTGKKKKDDAFDEDRKKHIDELVAKAEQRAGDEALLAGNASGASAAARTAGKDTRARLTEMAKKGALPGEVERGLLRVAGFDDVEKAPPPPIIITNQDIDFTVTIPLQVAIHTGENPESVVDDIAAKLEETMERDLLPRVTSMIATTFRR